MKRQLRKRYGKYAETVAGLAFLTILGLFIAAREGNLLAQFGLLVVVLILVALLLRTMLSIWTMMQNSMVVHSFRRFKTWWKTKRTNDLALAPAEFGIVANGELVYSLAEQDPRDNSVRAIKLGWTGGRGGKGIAPRLKEHQTSSSMRIVLISSGPGTYDYEQHILRQTKRCATGGGSEWRWPTDDVWKIVLGMPGIDQKVVAKLMKREPVAPLRERLRSKTSLVPSPLDVDAPPTDDFSGKGTNSITPEGKVIRRDG